MVLDENMAQTADYNMAQAVDYNMAAADYNRAQMALA
jgi:hypothetical protein